MNIGETRQAVRIIGKERDASDQALGQPKLGLGRWGRSYKEDQDCLKLEENLQMGYEVKEVW